MRLATPIGIPSRSPESYIRTNELTKKYLLCEEILKLSNAYARIQNFIASGPIDAQAVTE